MRSPLSLTPSLSFLLDEGRDRVGAGPRPPGPALRQTRFASDALGLTLFFVMLGTYLVARL